MKIAYLYERPVSEGEAMGAEKTYVDFAKTRRLELTDLICGGGLKAGDTLLLRAKSDLGKSREADRHVASIEALGVEIVVLPTKANKRLTGRPARAEVKDMQTFDLICGLWYSPTPVDHAIQRASDRVGVRVDRNWINARCGPRSGQKAKEKRAAMEKKLDNQEDAAKEIERLRRDLASFACDCDHRCYIAPGQLASDGGCSRYKARQYTDQEQSDV